MVIDSEDPSVSVLSLLSKTCCLLRFVLCPAGTWELHLCCLLSPAAAPWSLARAGPSQTMLPTPLVLQTLSLIKSAL